MNAVDVFLVVVMYVFGAACTGVVCNGERVFIRVDVSRDARAALEFVAAVLWPFTLMYYGWRLLRVLPAWTWRGLRCLGRGTRDLYHVVRPRKNEIPFMIVLPRERQDMHHVNDGCGPDGCPLEARS